MGTDTGSSESAYLEFIKDVEIGDIFLVSLDTRRPKSMGTTISYDVAVKPPEVSTHEGGFAALFSFRVKAFVDLPADMKPGNKEPDFLLKAAMQVNYKVKKTTPDKDILSRFVDKNVPLNVWPFCRELVASVTQRMGIPPLILPTYKAF